MHQPQLNREFSKQKTCLLISLGKLFQVHHKMLTLKLVTFLWKINLKRYLKLSKLNS
jgi:hypothetical protein